MAKKYTGPERRRIDRRNVVQLNGRRQEECAAHALIMGQVNSHSLKFDNLVSWKLVSLLLGFSVIIVGAGFKYMTDDLGKTKEAMVVQIQSTAEHALKTASAMSQIQKEIATALLDHQRENRIQFERLQVQAENTTKIQAVIMTEINEIKKRNDRIDDKRRP